VEPSRVGGLGVLDPSLLLHGASVSTPVLARADMGGQDLLCRGKGFGWDFRGLVAIRAPRPYPPRGPEASKEVDKRVPKVDRVPSKRTP